MISVAEADALILKHSRRYRSERRKLEDAYGAILREEIRAERDQPPFDRVMMDGIALASAQCATGVDAFHIEGRQPAGHPPLSRSRDNGCIEVATGAMLPAGCDTVVPVEQYRVDNGIVTLADPSAVRPMQNVHRAGTDHRRGTLLLPSGRRLGAGEIAVAAASGAADIAVAKLPSVALVATGTELVPPGRPMSPHHIRLSSIFGLEAALEANGFSRTKRFHFADEAESLETGLREILDEWEVLILTGGVSMGTLDLIPATMERLGITCRFHKIAQRPGKPFWFGTGAHKQPVFALPGNPVSTAVCFSRYVLPQLLRASGYEAPRRELIALAEDVVFEPKMTLFRPVNIEQSEDGQRRAFPLRMNTSGDFGVLAQTPGFVELDSDRSHFPAGHAACFYPWA